MKRLADAIQLAQLYREESWDGDNDEYTMSIKEAADKAARDVGFDTRGTEPVYLLITLAWNDIADWAKLYIEEN